MGDTTPIFNNFWRKQDAVPEYSISLTPFREVSNIWKVHYLDDDGWEINTTFDYFIWSRSFSVPGVGQNEFAVSYSPTRAIKCFKNRMIVILFENALLTIQLWFANLGTIATTNPLPR
ncbi:MAG: hypothetical protein AAFY41_14180 [Bacteroidota bacterium]